MTTFGRRSTGLTGKVPCPWSCVPQQVLPGCSVIRAGRQTRRRCCSLSTTSSPKASIPPIDDVELKQADGTALPFTDGQSIPSYQFGMMLYPDKAKGLHEAYRMLTGGGRYLFTVWDERRFNPVGRVLDEIIAGMFASDPPRLRAQRRPVHRSSPRQLRLVRVVQLRAPPPRRGCGRLARLAHRGSGADSPQPPQDHPRWTRSWYWRTLPRCCLCR